MRADFFNIGLLCKHEELAELAMKNARWAYVKTRYRENEDRAKLPYRQLGPEMRGGKIWGYFHPPPNWV